MADNSNSSDAFLVRDLMAVGVPTCTLDTPVIDLARLMIEKDWEAFVVLESKQGHGVGVVSRRDILQAYTQNQARNRTAEQLMRAGLPTVPPEIPLTAAVQIMLDLGVRALYITHHAGGIEYPAAWLTFDHLLRHLSGGPVEDLGVGAERETPIETFIKRRDEARRKAGYRE